MRRYRDLWEKAAWLAYRDGEAVAYLGLGPASDDASTIICDEGTTSVSGVFTREDVRGEGIGTALLDRGLRWARERGFERCAVDFEPVCYTVMRCVDAGEVRNEL
jgi:GNAT superfamily N-acetyltransferase